MSTSTLYNYILQVAYTTRGSAAVGGSNLACIPDSICYVSNGERGCCGPLKFSHLSMCSQKVMVNISITMFGKKFEKNTTIFRSYLLTPFCSKKCISLSLPCCSSCGLCIPKKNPYVSHYPCAHGTGHASCPFTLASFDCFCLVSYQDQE